MALFNFKAKKENKTVNLAGGAAYVQTPEMALASLLLTSFVKDQFYRDTNQATADLAALMAKVDPLFAAKAGIYARNVYGMRSITHILAVEMAAAASGKTWAKAFYESIIRRPDDMLEIAALYRSLGGKNLPNAMKKGFAAAFDRFDGYQLAKYRGEDKAFKLVDLVNLVHPTASDKNAEALRLLVAGNLKNKDTWESKLSEAGQVATSDAEKSELKAAAWGELISSGKLGYLALLRNIRNIAEQAPELEADVAKALTNRERIKKSLVMPFQIMVAMEALEASSVVEKRRLLNALTDALDISLDNVPRFEGKTLVVLDDSGSMTARAKGNGFGSRSCLELGAMFAAALFKSNHADLMRFSDDASYVRANARDSVMTIAGNLIRNARASGTDFHQIFLVAAKAYDRIVILSDMQGWMSVGTPNGAFVQYQKRSGANPFVYSFDLAGYGSLQLPESKIFCLAGFSDKVFDTMKMLETDRHALVNTIHAVDLN